MKIDADVYAAGIEHLKEVIEQEDWIDRVQVIIEDDKIKGYLGPQLDTVEIDWENKLIYVEDVASEVTFKWNVLMNIDYSEDLVAWRYIFDRGIAIILYDYQ